MNALELFAGIGCSALGLERAGVRHVAFCERDEFCRRVLAKHWHDTPCFSDVRQLTIDDVRHCAIDLVAGGFPCQKFSTASRGRRVAPDLWPDMLRIIRAVRPSAILAENVQEAAIANAARDLDREGYRPYYRRVSGADCGADHQRDRWWVCAYADKESELRRAIDAEVAKLPALCAGLWGPRNYARAIRVLDGPADRMDRVGAIGNGQIPQIAEAFGRALISVAGPLTTKQHERE